MCTIAKLYTFVKSFFRPCFGRLALLFFVIYYERFIKKDLLHRKWVQVPQIVPAEKFRGRGTRAH